MKIKNYHEAMEALYPRLSEYLEDKKKISKEVVKLENQLNLQIVKVREITSLLDEKKGKVRLKDLIQNESSKQVKEIFNRSQGNYSILIGETEEQKSGLEADRSKLNNKELKESIISRFNTLIDLFLIKLNVHTLSSDGFSAAELTCDWWSSHEPG